MGRFAERIVHVDMDAFFVEVERLRRPDLTGRRVVVGGDGPRGVVASASYEARRAGVRSAMPIALAKRSCPGLIVVPPDHDAYRRMSSRVMRVLESFTPVVEPLSVDEAFLDIGGLSRGYASPAEVGERIRRAVRDETRLPSSVGLATSKLVAKMASRAAKPDGIVIVEAGSELEFLHPHPVRSLWGVGEATFARLEELGIGTVGDLAGFPRATLVRRLGSGIGGMLWDLAAGIDDRPVGHAAETHSISVEETYGADLDDPDDIDRELVAHADRLGRRLRSGGVVATTVHLKVRYSDFTTVTRSHTFEHPVSTRRDLLEAARLLLPRTQAGRRPVRLLGLGVSGLEDSQAPRQLGFGAEPWDAVEEALDRVQLRFGRDAVSRARLRGSRGAVDSDADGEGVGILGPRPPPENPHAPR